MKHLPTQIPDQYVYPESNYFFPSIVVAMVLLIFVVVFGAMCHYKNSLSLKRMIRAQTDAHNIQLSDTDNDTVHTPMSSIVVLPDP